MLTLWIFDYDIIVYRGDNNLITISKRRNVYKQKYCPFLMQIKKSVVIISLAALLIVPFASAGFFDFITGMDISRSTELNLTINNTYPEVRVVGTTSIPELLEETSTNYSFLVKVYDHDGVRDVNTSTVVNVNFTLGSEDQRDAVCELIESDFDNKLATYNCTVIFWYWDAPGNWIVQASANDSDGAMAYNLTQTLGVPNQVALKIYPDSITWNTALNPDAQNETASVNTILNNTGNIDFESSTVDYITINSTNLTGDINPLEQIGANLFSVLNSTDGNKIECAGDMMVESEFTNVTSILYSGNLSAGEAQENLYYCLTQVPSTIEKQKYGTQNRWVIQLNNN